MGHIEKLEDYLLDKPTKLASITGRYYAMDRDKRWERVKLAYDALVNNVGDLSASPQDAIKANYENGITDEFIKPIIVSDNNRNSFQKYKTVMLSSSLILEQIEVDN